MAEEYTRRYGREHKSEAVIRWCARLPMGFPEKGLTPFAQAMPEQYKNECAVTAYRAYYHGEKAATLQHGNRRSHNGGQQHEKSNDCRRPERLF